MVKLYGAKPSLADFLFESWKVELLASTAIIDRLLNADLVKSAISPRGLSLIKSYTESELAHVGLTLNACPTSEHEYVDNGFQYRWKQVYHGPADSWLDLYEVVEPTVDDGKIKATITTWHREGN